MFLFIEKVKTIKFQLALISLILASIVMTTYLFGFHRAKTQVLDVDGEMFTHVLHDSIGLMDALNEQVTAGNLTLEQAQETARTYILGPKLEDGTRDISKTKMSANNYMYLWATKPDGTITMHSFNFEGQNLWNYEVNGRYTLRESYSNLNKTGFVFEEYWRNPGEPVYTFIAYQEYYKPWNWIVGAGGRKEIIYANRLAGMKGEFWVIGLLALLSSIILLLIFQLKSNKQLAAEKEQHRQNMEYLAFHDELTKLPNRRLFYQRLKQEIEESQVTGQKLAVLFLDMNRFKSINDSMGHIMGDQLLQMVADRLKLYEKENLMVARSGGDEFILLHSNILDDTTAIQTAESIFERISQPVELGNIELHITASIGIAIYPRDGLNCETLLKNADVAMYQVKGHGQAKIQIYRASMNDRLSDRLKLEMDIRKALDRNELFLLYQPLFDAKTQKIVGVEALLRWQHHQLGVVSPNIFIPLAEETGVILTIGEWVLKKACAQIKRWQQGDFHPIGVSVNMSAIQLHQKDIVNTIRRVLEDTGLDPIWLEIEITESALMHSENAQIIQEIQALGVSIAIDDFGTGYNSLSYLREFKLDTLKVDQSFIRNIPTNTGHAALLQSIVALGHNLKMKVVAEGVETVEQFLFLRDINCNEFQGYFFSKPVPIKEIEELLQKDNSLSYKKGYSTKHE